MDFSGRRPEEVFKFLLTLSVDMKFQMNSCRSHEEIILYKNVYIGFHIDIILTNL